MPYEINVVVSLPIESWEMLKNPDTTVWNVVQEVVPRLEPSGAGHGFGMRDIEFATYEAPTQDELTEVTKVAKRIHMDAEVRVVYQEKLAKINRVAH